MAALALSMLLASLGTSIANIALPALTGAFSASFQHVQWVVLAYLATLTVSVIVAGWLGDAYGLRRMQFFGLGLFASAALLCGVAPNLWILVGARAIQGIGAAFLMTLTMALMRETAGEDRIGRAMGLLGTVSALGTALGPSLGGVLLSIAGWQGIFLVQFPLAILALVLAFIALPQGSPRETGRSSGQRPLKTKVPFGYLTANLLVAAVMMTTLVVGPFYLGLGLGLTELAVGLVMAVGPVTSIFSGIPSGRVVDAWGARRVLGGGLILLLVATLLLSFLPHTIGVVGYALSIAILAVGYQLFQAATNTAVLAEVPKDQRGGVSGLLNLSRNLGLIAGASAMGAVFALVAGTDELGHAPASAVGAGLRITFLLAGGMTMVALLITRRLSR
ncbi:MFS transporter [Paracoccus sp. DMF-8]|uniref:MFS transporter n=1 Tax=Paracoccus sp. DMF-8 TaxID=3019445 RepID=UPI0023E85488|nr:MFS transporter [Paracoccus sp. DMF-8]MDF3606702.1 MFS transporter [Paracoccus sp. DMF-8]